MKKNKESLYDVLDTIKRSNFCITGISKGEEIEKRAESLFKEINVGELPESGERFRYPVYEAHRSPNTHNLKRSPLRTIIKIKETLVKQQISQ